MGGCFDCGGGLFAKLHVDGLWTFATAVRLRFKGNPSTLVKRGGTPALHCRDMQEYILAAVVRRDEAESPRMIEELDRTALTHGKLLFPFQFVRRYLAVRMPRQVQKAGKETTLLPKEHTRPISTRVRSLPAKR